MRQLWTWVTGIWVAASLVLGFALPPIYDKSTGAVLLTPQIGFFHIPAAVTMLLAFMASAGYGVAWLRTRQARYDAFSFAYAEIGMVLGYVATVTGMVFAKTNWGAYWSWDPQQVGVLATLLTYAALFALRGAVEDDVRRRDLWAVYAIFGCAIAVFGSAIYRRLLPDMATLHPKNTLLYSDSLNQFALCFSILGFTLLMVRVALLRMRLAVVQERQRARTLEGTSVSTVERGEEVTKGKLVWR